MHAAASGGSIHQKAPRNGQLQQAHHDEEHPEHDLPKGQTLTIWFTEENLKSYRSCLVLVAVPRAMSSNQFATVANQSLALGDGKEALTRIKLES